MMEPAEFLIELANTGSIEEFDALFQKFLKLRADTKAFSQQDVDIMLLECELFKYRKNVLLSRAE